VQVVRALDLRLSRAVAIKLRIVDDPASRSVFEAEVQTMVSLCRHPGLLHLYDAGIDTQDGCPVGFIATELMATTLGAAMADNTLSSQQIACVGRLMAQALAGMHQRRIVHRGVTPASVLLVDPALISEAQPCARLADFSTALAVTGGPESGRTDMDEDVRSLGLLLLDALIGASGVAERPPVQPRDTRPAIPDWLNPAWQVLIADMCADDRRNQLSAAEAAIRVPLGAELSRSGFASGRSRRPGGRGGPNPSDLDQLQPEGADPFDEAVQLGLVHFAADHSHSRFGGELEFLESLEVSWAHRAQHSHFERHSRHGPEWLVGRLMRLTRPR
jgi:serine/threonine protein kinase